MGRCYRRPRLLAALRVATAALPKRVVQAALDKSYADVAESGGAAAGVAMNTKAQMAAVMAKQHELLRSVHSAASSRAPPRPAALTAADVSKAICPEAAMVGTGAVLRGERLPWFEGPLLVKDGQLGWTWHYFLVQQSARCQCTDQITRGRRATRSAARTNNV
jgi:hypothetical protein